MIKTVQSFDEMNDVQMMMWERGDKAWWVLFSFIRPIKGFGHV